MQFLDDAADRFSPSMRQRVALDELYPKALRRARGAVDGLGAAVPLPNACPFTLEALLAGDVIELIAKLRPGLSPASARS